MKLPYSKTGLACLNLITSEKCVNNVNYSKSYVTVSGA